MSYFGHFRGGAENGNILRLCHRLAKERTERHSQEPGVDDLNQKPVEFITSSPPISVIVSFVLMSFASREVSWSV